MTTTPTSSSESKPGIRVVVGRQVLRAWVRGKPNGEEPATPWSFDEAAAHVVEGLPEEDFQYLARTLNVAPLNEQQVNSPAAVAGRLVVCAGLLQNWVEEHLQGEYAESERVVAQHLSAAQSSRQAARDLNIATRR